MAAPLLAAIPAIISAITAAAGTAKTIADAVPGRYDKHNRRRIKELAEGERGLTDDERFAMERTTLDPVRAMATEARQRGEVGASLTGRPDLVARGQEAEQGALAEATGAATAGIAQADAQRGREQDQELERRLALQKMGKKARAASAFESVGQISSVVGDMAGAAPGTFNLSGMFGTPVSNPTAFSNKLAAAGWEPGDIQYMIELDKKKPGSIAQIVQDSAEMGPLYDWRVASYLDKYGAF